MRQKISMLALLLSVLVVASSALGQYVPFGHWISNIRQGCRAGFIDSNGDNSGGTCVSAPVGTAAACDSGFTDSNGTDALGSCVATPAGVAALCDAGFIDSNGTTISGSCVRGYLLTYSGNGSSGTIPMSPTLYPSGTTITVAANTGGLSRSGYTFSGWNTSSNGNETSYSPGSTLTLGSSNVVLYAKWTDDAISGMASTLNGWGWAYTCSNAVATGQLCSCSGSYSSSRTLPGNSSKIYTMSVSINARFGGKCYTGGTSVGNGWYVGGSRCGDARWEWFQLSIGSPYAYYYANSGTENYTMNNLSHTQTFTVNGGTTITTTGGASDKTCINGGAFSYLGTYYANGGAYGTLTVNSTTPQRFFVFYDGNGNTSGSVPTDSTAYANGNTVTTRSNSGALARTGYVFTGWNTRADGSGTSYGAGTSTFAMPNMDQTLFAQWSQ